MTAALRSLALLAIVLCQPAFAGGAWPRGKGHGFVSVTWSTFGDLVGYFYALQTPLLEEPTLDLTEEIGTYAEYGLTDRLTFGLDRYNRPTTDTGSSIWFLRANLGSFQWKNRYGVELGLGSNRNWLGETETVYRLGVSWGRGFDTRWGAGWIDVDAKVATLSDSGSVLWKVDNTLGFQPNERSTWSLQMQSGALDGYPSYLRAVPAYVRDIGHGFRLESALLIGLQNDESQGMKVGAWYEF